MQPRQAPPEHPFPEYPRPNVILRFLTNVRDHGFALAVVGTLLVVVGVFHQFQRWDEEDPGVLMIPLQRGSTTLAAGAPSDSMAILTVDTYPEGAEIFVGEISAGITPLTRIHLPPGTYDVSIQKSAYHAVDSTITLAAGESAVLAVPLQAAPADGEMPRLALATDAAPPPAPRAPAERGRRRAPEPAAAASHVIEPVPVPEPRPDLGRLEVRTDPEGAAVWMDGRLVGHTPLSLTNVAPGRRSISLRLDGYDAPSTTIEVRAGHTATVSPRLDPLVGTLAVLAKPWGSIYIDGELKREASDVRYATPLPPGRYRVTVAHPVLGQWETVAEVEAGKEASFVVDFNRINTSGSNVERTTVRGW